MSCADQLASPTGRPRAVNQGGGWTTVPLDPSLLFPVAQRPNAARDWVCHPLSYFWKRPTLCAQCRIQSTDAGRSSHVSRSSWFKGEVESHSISVSSPWPIWPVTLNLQTHCHTFPISCAVNYHGCLLFENKSLHGITTWKLFTCCHWGTFLAVIV